MEFKEAVETCHVRSAIYREGDKFRKDGSGRLKLYGKNHQIPLKERVPIEDQKFDDWEEYDPEEDYMRG